MVHEIKIMSEVEEGSVQSCEESQQDKESPQTTGHQEEEESGISFNPPVYRQRYAVVAEMVKKYQAKRVLDFGCAEGKLLQHLIRNETITLEQLVGVDIDKELLKENAFKIEPLLCDWLITREAPFTVSILQGSISQSDDRFCNFDLISCVEIIEHLIPEHLVPMPAVVFGQLSPKVAIVTTPNADFNVLFPNLEGFRHWDHKFEWTRQEFQEWATTQATKYGYNVTFQGIGNGPVGTEHLGCCSQMALFERKESTPISEERQTFGQPYELIKQVEYPYRKSTISKEQKIIYEVERVLWFLSQPTGYENETNYNDDDDGGGDYYDDDDRPKTYELAELFKVGRLKELCGTIEKLRSVVEESSLHLSSDSKSVLYTPPQWESDKSDDDSYGWDDHKNDDKPLNDESLDERLSPKEDWDLEDNTDSQEQNDNVCWNNPNAASVYWDGSDNIDSGDSVAACNNHGSGSDDEDSGVNYCSTPWMLNNDCYETQNNDDDDECLNDCALGDDGLPWMTSNIDIDHQP